VVKIHVKVKSKRKFKFSFFFFQFSKSYFVVFEGDSGGGLYSKQTIVSYEAVVTHGIVSYGEGCGRVGIPGYEYFNLITNYN
jgi:hypothetical protein